MTDAIIAAAVFGGFALIIKIITDAITRHRLIDKGLVDENVKYLFMGNRDVRPLSNVKWGLVLIGIGAALMLRQFAPFYVRDESMFGLMSLFAGIAFLAYYFMAKGDTSKDKN